MKVRSLCPSVESTSWSILGKRKLCLRQALFRSVKSTHIASGVHIANSGASVGLDFGIMGSMKCITCTPPLLLVCNAAICKALTPSKLNLNAREKRIYKFALERGTTKKAPSVEHIT